MVFSHNTGWSICRISRLRISSGSVCGCAKTAGTCRELLHGEVSMFLFAFVDGVEPTNNRAEVRFVDQKPTLNKVWGIGPERKSSDARELENLLPVSV